MGITWHMSRWCGRMSCCPRGSTREVPAGDPSLLDSALCIFYLHFNKSLYLFTVLNHRIGLPSPVIPSDGSRRCPGTGPASPSGRAWSPCSFPCPPLVYFLQTHHCQADLMATGPAARTPSSTAGSRLNITQGLF